MDIELGYGSKQKENIPPTTFVVGIPTNPRRSPMNVLSSVNQAVCTVLNSITRLFTVVDKSIIIAEKGVDYVDLVVSVELVAQQAVLNDIIKEKGIDLTAVQPK